MRYQEPSRLTPSVLFYKRLDDIMESGNYTNGKYVQQFEQEYKECFKLAGECVAVNGCQSGLMLVLQALHVNKPIVPDFTFSATANAAYWACGGMVTGDCDKDTFNLKLKKLPDEIDGVIATHIFGNPCDCDYLKELTDPEHIPLIYDAAHAHGAFYNGKSIGDFGTASVFSLSPTKHLTAAEGGMIVTPDKELANRLRTLRNYGTQLDYQQSIPGLNARMSEVHAIVGLESLISFWDRFKHRLLLVEEYMGYFPDRFFQKTTPKGVHAFKDFSLVLGDRRDKALLALREHGIEGKTYFRPVSDLECFRTMTKRQKNSTDLYNSIIQLPLHTNMTLRDVRKVCAIVGGTL